MTLSSHIDGILVIPRLRVQNANAISSPMTWGFPAISAFLGLMQALDRKLPEHIGLMLEQVGVVCNHFEPQVTEGGYTRAFCLTRNPVSKDGSTAAISEEGRAHLEVSLIFGVKGQSVSLDDGQRQTMAEEIGHIVEGMRIAGGSVIPSRREGMAWQSKPRLIPVADSGDEWQKQFRHLRRQLLPGFALVSRHDLLEKRLAELQSQNPAANAMDAWLDLSRLHVYPEATGDSEGEDSGTKGKVEWQVRRPPGWTVPIPVGYGALSDIYEPGQVARARDSTTPFRFVETLYSIGEWVSPHRLNRIEDLFWKAEADPDVGLYQCKNAYGERRLNA